MGSGYDVLFLHMPWFLYVWTLTITNNWNESIPYTFWAAHLQGTNMSTSAKKFSTTAVWMFVCWLVWYDHPSRRGLQEQQAPSSNGLCKNVLIICRMMNFDNDVLFVYSVDWIAVGTIHTFYKDGEIVYGIPWTFSKKWIENLTLNHTLVTGSVKNT